jgi:hypothetical protein
MAQAIPKPTSTTIPARLTRPMITPMAPLKENPSPIRISAHAAQLSNVNGPNLRRNRMCANPKKIALAVLSP